MADEAEPLTFTPPSTCRSRRNGPKTVGIVRAPARAEHGTQSVRRSELGRRGRTDHPRAESGLGGHYGPAPGSAPARSIGVIPGRLPAAVGGCLRNRHIRYG